MTAFEITRVDGRSDPDIVLEVLTRHQPGEIIPYEAFAQALTEGEDRTFGRKEVQQAVGRTKKRYLRGQKRALEAVPSVGYRIVEAHEHTRIANKHREKAKEQFRQGLDVLTNVDTSKLTPEQQQMRDGQLLLTSACWHQLAAIEADRAASDMAIQDALRSKADGQTAQQTADKLDSVLERLSDLEQQFKGKA